MSKQEIASDNDFFTCNYFYIRFKCCAKESTRPDTFDQTIGPIKFQCQKDIRKSMNNTWEMDMHDEDSVLKVTTCDRAVQMKAMMFCTIDCVAQKMGVVSC